MKAQIPLIRIEAASMQPIKKPTITPTKLIIIGEGVFCELFSMDFPISNIDQTYQAFIRLDIIVSGLPIPMDLFVIRRRSGPLIRPEK
jgi:hypothetical protein